MLIKNKLKQNTYHLQTKKMIEQIVVKNVGSVYMASKDNFPVLDGITCYTLEVFEECMRLPHWHPNAAELGYVVSGAIEVIIWRSPGETAVMTLQAGMCWFIPQSALHSLNNISKERAVLLVSFSADRPQDIDLPVAFNGIPAPVRDAYTSPHTALRDWQGVSNNPLVGHYPVNKDIKHVIAASPYGFDFAKVTPLFDDQTMGSVVWGIKSNWSILENISVLRAHLKPGTARDAIWYPDVGTLYVVSQGKGEFHLVIADQPPISFNAERFDYIFVPTGVLHTFLNTHTEDFEVIAFFTKANPQPEVSLSVATSFFPKTVRNAAMTAYANAHKTSNPLNDLNYTEGSPYLLKLSKTK